MESNEDFSSDPLFNPGQTKEISIMKENNKRQRESIRDVEEKRDRLSELSDCVLMYIMEFIDTRDAVRTCVLSKRWMHLWRRLTNLVFDSSQFCNVANFNKFVSCLLSGRDGSFSLRNLKFRHCQRAEPKLLNRLTKYAVLHNVQHCSILFNLNYRTIFELCPVIFSCKSLTFLKLALSTYNPFSMLPKSLKMPALKRLELKCFTFNASESGNGYAEPFSSCKDTSNPDSVSAQHPCFIQLKSLKVLQKRSFHENCISVERINRALEYILQNSLLDRIDVIFD
ncbi:hypothetical protein Fmac_015868 [Flemingia macrophylla]|uniref:F-box domain-containing protein n=1 Tax=Flemingia macrophylla TaxID=520843 RepID=A0ABD1MHW8_9FABA